MTKSSRLHPTTIHRLFFSLPDPRRRHTRIQHPLLNLVAIALCGTIAGANDWEEIVQFAKARHQWLSRFLDLSQGIPSHDTFERVFAMLDPVAFQRCLLAWVRHLHDVTQGQIIAIDGKVAREAMARAGEQGPLTLVSAWATANQVCLGQVAGESGSNELGALPKLLDILELKGAIVTLDALGCQKNIVSQIVEKNGDYVIGVKGNQEKLETAVKAAFEAAAESKVLVPSITRVEQKHGRKELRVYSVLPVGDEFAELAHWKGLKSVVKVSREYEDGKGKKHTGTRYYISSLPAEAQQIAGAVRGHWGIENGLHWVLDVAFREDRNRSLASHCQANLGIIRRTAISLLRNTDGLTGSIHCRRQQAAWNEETLEKILFGCLPRQI